MITLAAVQRRNSRKERGRGHSDHYPLPPKIKSTVAVARIVAVDNGKKDQIQNPKDY